MHMQDGHSGHEMQSATVRRFIFLKVSNVQAGSPSDAFDINATRTPES